MTIFDQTVNITIIFSVYSIYITYLFRPVNSTDVWLLVDWNTRPWNLWIVQFGILAILNLCKLGPLEGVTFGKLLIWCSVRSNEPVKAKKLSVAICSRYFIIWLDYKHRMWKLWEPSAIWWSLSLATGSLSPTLSARMTLSISLSTKLFLRVLCVHVLYPLNCLEFDTRKAT